MTPGNSDPVVSAKHSSLVGRPDMRPSDVCKLTIDRVRVDGNSGLRRKKFGKRNVAVTIVSTNFRGTSGVATVRGVQILKAGSFMGRRTSVFTRDDRNVVMLSYVNVGRPNVVANATPRTSF